MEEKEWYKSKKFWAAMVAAVCGVVKASCDVDLEWAIYPLLAYLLSQGIADVGKYGKK